MSASLQQPPRGTIIVVVPTYPMLSETFVYREVRGLRNLGWEVLPVGLRPPAPNDPRPAQAGLPARELYGPNLARTLLDATFEGLRNPLRTASTMGRAIADALYPKEPLSPTGRAKVIAQAIAGVALARWARARGVEHIHCHFAHSATAVGMYAARQAGIPFSFVGHANDIFQRRSLLRRKLERAATVSCISEWHRELYRELAPAGADRYVVIRCGVDVDAWTGGAGLERPAPPLAIVSVGRLVEKKGFDVLLVALARAAADGLDYRLTIAGDGPQAETLRDLCHDLGQTDRIEFAGAVSNERVRDLLHEAQVFALPCREDSRGDRDGIPVVLMEAMACRVPVVAGDLPAIRELIVDGTSGFLIDGGDDATLARRLRELADRRELRRKIGDRGRQRIEEEFSLHVNAARLDERIRATAAPTQPP